MFSLFANTAVAAPETIVGGIKKVSQDIRFSFLSSNLAINFPNWIAVFFSTSSNSPTETFPDRVQIYPGSVTIKEGTKVVFAAVGYDADNEPLSGLAFNWTMTDSANRFSPRILPDSVFEGFMPGTFTVKAEVGGRQAEVTVTVSPSDPNELAQINSGKIKPIQISSRSSKENSKEQESDKSLNTNNLLDEGGWNENNWNSADDPGNLPGNPPGRPADDGAGNGNFQLSAPFISLPGRGIDLALNLNYNSRLWNKSGSQLTYDIDRGFPAPGWSLDFGKIAFMGAQGGCMMVDADGTRRGYTGEVINWDTRTSFTGHTLIL